MNGSTLLSSKVRYTTGHNISTCSKTKRRVVSNVFFKLS